MKQAKIATSVVRSDGRLSVVSARTIYYPMRVGVTMATIPWESSAQMVGSAVVSALDALESVVRDGSTLEESADCENGDEVANSVSDTATATVFRTLNSQQLEYIVSAHEPGNSRMAAYVTRIVLNGPSLDEIGDAVIDALNLASMR